jgi:hypothetical protein
MGYYQVSLKRKRAAVKTLAAEAGRPVREPATPDGTLAASRGITRAVGRVAGWLARCLPFLGRTTPTELKEAADAGASTERMSVSRRLEWNDQAEDKDKIELLHRQVELLQQELTDVRQKVPRVEAGLSSALGRSEARHQDAYQQLTGRLEARKQRGVRVDAHGIWPIWLRSFVRSGIREQSHRSEPESP